jgi:glycine/D-amino acid oxidase-like deaminating enzyme
MELASRDFIRHFAETHKVDCDINCGVDAVQLFHSDDALRACLPSFLSFLPLELFGSTLFRAATQAALGVEIILGAEQLKETAFPRLRNDFRVTAGVRLKEGCDSVWAAKLARAVVDEAEQLGADVRVGTPVVAVRRAVEGGSELGLVVETPRGNVRCRWVVHATNGYAAALVPQLRGRIRPVCNHVACTVPLPPLGTGARRIGVSVEEGFVYFLQREDGRVILGGFRNRLPGKGVREEPRAEHEQWGWDGSGCLDMEIVKEMASFLPRMFSALPTLSGEENLSSSEMVELEATWTGTIGWSCDGLPWVGPLALLDPSLEGQYICAGFSGHGMTQTWLCGRAIASMIATEASADVTGGLTTEPFVEVFHPRLGRGGSSWESGEPSKSN